MAININTFATDRTASTIREISDREDEVQIRAMIEKDTVNNKYSTVGLLQPSLISR